MILKQDNYPSCRSEVSCNPVTKFFSPLIFSEGLPSSQLKKMKMIIKLVLNVALLAGLLQLATATDHAVGAPGGSWDLGTDQATWASSKKFLVGDTLTFQYTPVQHNVFEVSKAEYDSCSASNPISTDSSGNTVISLKSTGKKYFICAIPGHCDAGMKLEVNVLAGSTPSPPPSASSPTEAETPESSPVSSPSEAEAPESSPVSSPSEVPTTPEPSAASTPSRLPSEEPRAGTPKGSSNNSSATRGSIHYVMVAVSLIMGLIFLQAS